MPLETESNLNFEQDNQESPIDLINETTKMKHLSQGNESATSSGVKLGNYEIKSLLDR